MTDQVYLQKINGNPGFVDGATIHPFASKAALDASGSGWEIGTIANAAGVPYSWGGAGVGWAAGGDVVLSVNDAASIAAAVSTTPVNFPIATIKANTIKDRENFSVSWLLASSGTYGGAFEIQLGGQPIIPSFNYGTNDSVYFTVVLSTLGTSTRRLRIFGNTYNIVVATLSIDMTQDAPVNIKITPGVGNSVSIQQFGIKRG